MLPQEVAKTHQGFREGRLAESQGCQGYVGPGDHPAIPCLEAAKHSQAQTTGVQPEPGPKAQSNF